MNLPSLKARDSHIDSYLDRSPRQNAITGLYKCEYCEGTINRFVERQAFKHRSRFVILENVTIGVGETCGNRYYSADILHAVEAVATGVRSPERTESIPVAHLKPN
ncbi:YgiT-type zinc finger protein [Spirulina subsalsa]|uniref:YgiT-type zinc finger protein n=1 Tax=Spirulina subsalsa TaxID=54311 RepID=UPI00192CC15B|nr:YgiT-type zinc finger protein [Spirulina subsalsa]